MVVLISPRNAGLDVVEQVLESRDEFQNFKSYATLIAHRAHFDHEIASRFSCNEIAAASILVTCDLLDDFTVLENVPSSLLTERAAEGAAALRQRVGSRESLNFPVQLGGGMPSAHVHMVETT